MAGLLSGQISLKGAEPGVMIADLLITPLWVLGGMALWRKHYSRLRIWSRVALSSQMLFVGLLIFLILQPFLSSITFRMEDFVVILVMGLVCFIPVGMFVRGILLRKD